MILRQHPEAIRALALWLRHESAACRMSLNDPKRSLLFPRSGHSVLKSIERCNGRLAAQPLPSIANSDRVNTGHLLHGRSVLQRVLCTPRCAIDFNSDQLTSPCTPPSARAIAQMKLRIAAFNDAELPMPPDQIDAHACMLSLDRAFMKRRMPQFA